MRILTVHADYIEVLPKEKAIKDAEDIKPELKRYEEVLVVFLSVEQGDEDVFAISSKTAEEIAKISEQVKCNNILLYPLVHLTSTPASPRVALAVLKKIEEILEKKYRVHRAPFGWYKAYTLKCKGHPLSELSRTIYLSSTSEKEEISESLKTEEKMKSQFYILDVDGKLYDIDKFDYSKHENLKKFVSYETKKLRSYEKEPLHIKLMREHALVDYEEGSDPGNFRWLPKGRLIKKILEREISAFCIDYGAFEVETPIMYDFDHPSLKKYLNRFPARQYVVLSDDKKLFLRFAACFGQFLLSHDMTISYKHLPLKMYELTRYSFRREQSGELAGLKRLRAFTMPDMHTLTENMEEAKREFENQLKKALEWNKRIGLEDLEVGFRVQSDFYKKNEEWYHHLVKIVGKPILLEMYDVRYAYFITKFEFNFIDSMDKASALGTVQIDVENSETYDISFVSRDGSKKRPYILHASFSGSLERVIYALLEKEAMIIEKGGKGNFPLFIAPTQLRLIPINNSHLKYAEEILKIAKGRKVRIDIDDSEESLSKKIRRAGKEWIPYVAVIGDEEVKDNKLTITERSTGNRMKLTPDEIITLIEKKMEGYVFEPISFGTHVSRRPF